jgi:hypothetical protein
MYRALTWWLLERGADTTDPEVVASLAAEPVIEVGTDPDAPWTRVDGADVSAAIRTREVTAAVSAVAGRPAGPRAPDRDAAADHRLLLQDRRRGPRHRYRGRGRGAGQGVPDG